MTDLEKAEGTTYFGVTARNEPVFTIFVFFPYK